MDAVLEHLHRQQAARQPAELPAAPAVAAAALVPTEPPAVAGGVSVSVAKIARAGAMVSGQVTFSDGQQAEWYLDQTGRLGVIPKQSGYKPTTADVQQFQMALEREMAKMGF